MPISIPVVFALIAFGGVFLFFLGISRMRRSAGGAEDFQARLAAYGVSTTTAGSAMLPPSSGLSPNWPPPTRPPTSRGGSTPHTPRPTCQRAQPTYRRSRSRSLG